ncbi:MAG TPA: cyclic nucleotide-binding domain-containing protein [Terriglobales bacterium]|nr:cyclic nucleotide-binding domain-containing protein [Terriglobales bacterium]
MKLQHSENDAVVGMLEKSPLWSGLDRQDIKAIVKIAKQQEFAGGDTIVKKGDEGTGFYLVLDGAVEIRSDGNTLSRLGPGHFFGEMSVVDTQPRSADVVAVEPSRVLFLSAWSFKSLVSERPRIAVKMLQEFVRRLRNTDRALSE